MAYQARVRTKRDLDSVLLPIGSGVELSRKHDPTHDRELRKDRRTGRGQSTPVSATLSASPATGSRMAKPNYAHQKKQREEAARKKREEKQQRRQQKKDETPTPGA